MSTADADIGPSAQIEASQVSKNFLDGMVNRMVVSYLKYGDVRDAYPHKMDALACLRDRLQNYIETQNTEYLIDAANFAMIEFMLPRLQGAHYSPSDSDQSPGRITASGERTHEENVVRYKYRRGGD